MRKSFALLIVLSMTLMVGSGFAAERPFAPVQDGPVQSAPTVQQWATDHLMVQFTAEGLQRASLPTPGEKASGAATKTGLASLDQAMADMAVTSLRAAYPMVANKSMASDLGTNRWYIFEVANGADIPAVAQRLAGDTNVAVAHPDWIAFPTAIPNDPLHSANWGHNNTAQLGSGPSHSGPGIGTVGFDANAHAAWNSALGYGDPAVVIAILDSGVDAGHPDLLQVTGYDFGDGDSNPTDDSADPGHGTACAGVAAAIANNALGVAGIAGGSSIMPLKVSNSAGNLLFSAIDNALYYAADNGADIASMSFGAATTSIPSTNSALTYAYNQGVTLLAATGNENANTISYPAIYSRVIGVGAASPCGDRKRSSDDINQVNPGINTDPNGTTCDDEYWWGSSYGSTVQDSQGAVDIIAPTILPTTDIQGSGGYAGGDYSNYFNGTSCATPYAAGVAALIKGANPTFSPNQVRAQLVGTAQDIVNVESVAGWDRYAGYGMVDAAAALGEIVPPGALADFSADVTSGCAPLTVNFTDLSTGTIDTWVWDFGDGELNASQNPSHTYTAAGTYDVSLSITSPEGDDATAKFGYITVSDAPAVAFSASGSFVVAGTSIDFTDESGGSPTAWAWDFGDGGTASVQNPSHTFNTAGVWHIKLVATNSCGADSLTINNMIIATFPPAPVAAFNFAPSSGCAPLLVDFSDQSTGTVTDWAWDFGDGNTSTLANPSHTYTTPGSYDVSLTVSNLGNPNTETLVDAVTVSGPPTASFTASSTSIAAGASVTFTDTSTDGPLNWTWDFGDGGTSNLQNPVHQYNSGGVFTVSLIAMSGCGPDTLTMVDYITVEASVGPVAAFSLTPATGCAPLEVTFTDESVNDVSTWNWDFGDGGQAAVQNPVYTYNAPGSYDVRLIVSGTGGVDSLTVTGAVVVEMPVVAAFAVSDTTGDMPLAVTFTDASSGSPTSWRWDFGDAGSDTVASPVHTYTAAGVYDVTLIVGNSCSADTLTMSAAVTVIDPASGVGDLAPVRFGLAQNYPNPFNPSTTLVYSLEKPGRARLEVFDMSGRRVATLVDEDTSAGRHEIMWRPAELASGIYFSRLTVGSETDTRRVTLLK